MSQYLHPTSDSSPLLHSQGKKIENRINRGRLPRLFYLLGINLIIYYIFDLIPKVTKSTQSLLLSQLTFRIRERVLSQQLSRILRPEVIRGQHCANLERVG